MSDLKGNYLENAYEILSPLQDTENCSAFLVKENSTGSLAVKKQLTFEQYELYQVLKEYTHPNLSKIYALYTCNGRYYALTEYISGATIFQTVEQGRTFSREEVRTYILQLCDVLFFLHKRGIIHRDITPGNIIISTDHVVKLIDFGIARIKKDGQTRDTQLLGTAGFASPEQFGFGQTDERSDIYSTGVLINYMLTGKLPAQKLSSDIFLSDIIVKCTQIDPANRFSNVGELHSVLLRRIPAASAAAVQKGALALCHKFLLLLPGFHKKKPLHILGSIFGYLSLILLTISSMDILIPFGPGSRGYWMVLIFLFYIPFCIFGNAGNYEAHIKNFAQRSTLYRFLVKCILFFLSFFLLFLYILIWEVIL
ncbi:MULTISPECIES: serine/threonine protein kinase [Mediterraneibacter]|uniref:serine/threonine protein kinase n=1 Tax=Mediterraneibacter TaxID=2316020 RepID=UPI0022E0AE9D|nr:serine/threonine-protein kinase [Mediterraneibacter massiliensis]